MKIGRYNYKLVVRLNKTPDLEQMRKDVKGLLENFGINHKNEFEIKNETLICSALEYKVYNDMLDDNFEMYMGVIGRNYGMESFGFPYWYYPK